MKYLKEQLGLYHPEVDSVFEGQDFSQALMIMDMQPGFLNPLVYRELTPRGQRLTEKIKDRAQDILENNGLVLLVEYMNQGPTIENITDVLQDHPSKVIRLEKDFDMLNGQGNSRDQRLKNNRCVSILKKKKIPLELCGVSICHGIKLSAMRMHNRGVNVKIPLYITQDSISSMTMTDELLEEYGEYSDLLDFGNEQEDGKHLRYVSDYL